MDSTDTRLSPVHDGNIVPSFDPTVAEIVDRSQRAVEKNLPLFIIVQYDHESDKISFQEKLKKVLVQEGLRVREFDPVHNEAHGTGKLYPLLAKASAENAVCLVFGLPRTGGEIRADHEFVHYLNIYRDRIVHERIRMILMLPARDAEQFIFSAGDLWDFRHATYWLERPMIRSSDIQWFRMESQTEELPVPEPDMAEIQTHIRNTRPLIDETHDPSEKAKLYLQLCQWFYRRNAHGPALEAAMEGLQKLEEKKSLTRAELEYWVGVLLAKKGHFIDAARHLKISFSLHKENSWGLPHKAAMFSQALGYIQMRMDDFHKSYESMLSSLSIYRKIGNRLDEAQCLESLGVIQMRMNDLSGAKSSHDMSLAIYREFGDRRGEADCLWRLGDLQIMMGDFFGAKASFDMAFPIYQEVDAKQGEADCLTSQGDLQMRMSDHSGAKSSFGAALPIYREIGDRLGEANCIKCLGDLQIQMSDHSGAFSFYGSALAIYREIGAKQGEGKCLLSQGMLMMAEGEPIEAFKKSREGLKLYEIIDDATGQQFALDNLARNASAANAADQALLLAEASLDIGNRVGDRFSQSITLQLQLEIWLVTQDSIPILAVLMLLLDLFIQNGNIKEAGQYAEKLIQLKGQIPPEAFQAIETDPESIRAAAIAQARERFAQTGRDLFDPPPEPE